MLVDEKKTYINGNTALEVNGAPLRDEEKYKELKKSQKERRKKLKIKERNKKLKTMGNIVTVFVVGMLLVGRYSVIYANQKNIINVKHELKAINSENESLKIKLLEVSDIASIEKVAREELEMVDPKRTNVMYSDLSKDNFGETADENKKEKEKWVSKIKDILF